MTTNNEYDLSNICPSIKVVYIETSHIDLTIWSCVTLPESYKLQIRGWLAYHHSTTRPTNCTVVDVVIRPSSALAITSWLFSFGFASVQSLMPNCEMLLGSKRYLIKKPADNMESYQQNHLFISLIINVLTYLSRYKKAPGIMNEPVAII